MFGLTVFFLFPLCPCQRDGCQFVCSLVRASSKLPGGLGRFLPCRINSHMSRLGHLGWNQCSHGLTSRPSESCHHQCIEAVCGVLGYPKGSIVDNPVPRHGFDEGLQSFSPGQSSAASSEQTVHIRLPHGGRHDLHPPSAADFSNPRNTADQGFFRTFPQYKKVRRSRALSRARVPQESGSWPP